VTRVLAFTALFVAAFSSPLLACEDSNRRWGVSIWGLSYHIDDAVEFDEVNVGLGVRRYVSRRVFVEVDALRNSNSGLAVPLSTGIEFRIASFGACSLHAVAAGTVVYYQNGRTDVSYVKAGPVPGLTLGCGRVKTNAIVVLRGDRQPVAAVAAALTIMVR
jgi:hypothetical protein